MNPNFEQLVNGKLAPFIPQSLDELFEAIRCDWTEHWSALLAENFVSHLN